MVNSNIVVTLRQLYTHLLLTMLLREKPVGNSSARIILRANL